MDERRLVLPRLGDAGALVLVPYRLFVVTLLGVDDIEVGERARVGATA